jgi:hypothetical protein
VHWIGYDTTSLDIEVDPQRCRFGSRKSEWTGDLIPTIRGSGACVCLLLQDLVQNCLRGGGDMGGHVLRETTSRGLCGLGCPSKGIIIIALVNAGEREIV